MEKHGKNKDESCTKDFKIKKEFRESKWKDFCSHFNGQFVIKVKAS